MKSNENRLLYRINARAVESVQASDEMRSAITGVDTEMVLTRQCADVSKLSTTCASTVTSWTTTCDGQLRASISASFCGDLPDHSWWQATTGGSCGGFGVRKASGAALPAFAASRIMRRSLVSTMTDHFSAAFDTPDQPILAECDTRTDEALSHVLSPPSPQPSRRTCSPSSTRYWLNASSCGATCSLALKTPCVTCPSLFTSRPWYHRDDEHHLARKRMKVVDIITACVVTSIQEELLHMHESEGS